MRAIVSHDTAPSAMNSSTSCPSGDWPPKNASSTMTIIMYGIAYSTSTIRIITSSTLPPR